MKQKLLKILYRFLALCARIYLSRHKIQVIAITGSVGKTSCRMVVTEVLKQVSHNTPHPNLASGHTLLLRNSPNLLKEKGQATSAQKNAVSSSPLGEELGGGLQSGEELRGEQQKKIYTSPKNYNSELGLVFSVFQIEDYHPSTKNLLNLSWHIFWKALFGVKNTDILVAEYGIDSPHDMDHLLKVALPDIAVLTKLDAVHSANFPVGGVEAYWQEKWKLLLASKKKVYLNLQDAFSQKHISLLKNYAAIFEPAGIQAKLQKDEHDIARWYFMYKGKTISQNLLGEENNHYVALGLDIAEDLGISLSQKEYHFDLELQAGRFSLFSYKEHILIDSSYNAAPESMRQVLANTKLLQKNLFGDYKLIAVLGDMRELDNPQEAHTQLASELLDFSDIFTIGPNMYDYMIPKLKELGFSGNITSSLSSRDIGQKLKNFLDETSEKYIVVFKGSQNTIFTEDALAVLLSSENQKKLPRQSEAWKVKKQEFFRGV